MQKIHLLPEHIIAKIAAGEIIERQVSAVKELIENALDANANSITIQLEEGGLKKIVVMDNGEGMDHDDLLLSYKPHTTSKLPNNELTGIATLGFRGEALWSIASVSSLTIQSRTLATPTGFQITLHAGSLLENKPVGMPVGTSISIQNIFSNIPARKKFLKSQQTEFRYVIDLVSRYAMVYPEIRFLLIHNKRTILDFPKKQTLTERASMILGPTISNLLIPVSSDNPYLKISGYIAHPQISTRIQNKQYLFINKRIVKSKVISAIIKKCYGSLIETSRYPVYILFLDIPFELIDVNIHPRKEKVGFLNSEEVNSQIKETIINTLAQNDLTFRGFAKAPFSFRAGTTNQYAARLLREQVEP